MLVTSNYYHIMTTTTTTNTGFKKYDTIRGKHFLIYKYDKRKAYQFIL